MPATDKDRLALADASQKDPIPSGVYFLADYWNFYDARTGASKGDAFLQTWIGRAHEFPQTRAESERGMSEGQ